MWEGVPEGVSPLNLGQCFLMDNQGHNHAVIIPKHNYQKEWKVPVENIRWWENFKISFEYQGTEIKNKGRPRKT